MKWIRKIGILLFAVLLWTACNPDVNRHSALGVVSKADSLGHAGQMYGVDAGDSVTLAQAYETLSSFNSPLLSIFNSQLSTDYAHACYHYGKLLRAKDNPVEAMQAFINATHSGTDDYHILGRVYSNIGSICHLAGEYSLSYDMYQRSAECFLYNKDTISYYYGINNMAFELAEQGKKDSVLLLINAIEESSTNEQILLKTLETKAVVCKKVEQYDSVLYYTSCLFSQGCYEPAVIQLRAQAYSFLGEKDSAVYYANYVLAVSDKIYDKNGALYILTHDDEKKDKQAIRKISADRSDVQKRIEIYQGKLSQATQLLEQDINRKPNWTWLYAIIATIAFIGIGITIYIYRKRRQHQLLSQKVNEMQSKSDAIKLQHEQMVHEHADYKNKLLEHLEYNCCVFTQSDNFPNNLNWKDFDAMCIVIDNNYNMLATKLRHKYILSEKEIRLCILVLMNTSRPRMAEILPYAVSGIGKFKDQTAKKIGTSGKKMHAYLLEMAVGD